VACTRDAAAFEELFRRYEPRAYAFFVKRTRSPERAQDLYQELFLCIHRARDRDDAERPFAPWLFQIAHRCWWTTAGAPIASTRYRSRSASLVRSNRAAKSGWVPARFSATHSPRSQQRDRHILVSSKLEGVAYPELAAQLGKSVAAGRRADWGSRA
jgi:RNA polymerase sigma-70 factor (ECF subfamily)